jgi:RNA polymerase sigma-70 factor (ECF subfamily)
MATDKPGTDQLLQLAAGGDKSAAEHLLDRCRPRLRRMISVRISPQISSRIDPSDVVQEALVEAFQKLPGFLETRAVSFYPWIRQIAWQRLMKLHRAHLDAERRSVRREAHDELYVTDESVLQLAERFIASETDPPHRVVRSELRERVRAALDQLDPIDREVLLMRYLEHMRLKEIAESLSITLEAAKKRHARALERLERQLTDPSP